MRAAEREVIEDLARLWEKAVAHAKRRGFGDESEDFASDLIQRKLEGKSKHATLDQSFMDYSSALRADKRVLGSPHGFCSKGLVTSLDKPLGGEDDDGATLSDLIGVSRDDMELRSDFGNASEILDRVFDLISDRRARDEIRRIYYQYLMEAV